MKKHQIQIAAFLVACAFVLAPAEDSFAQANYMRKGVASYAATATGVADGTHTVYVDLREFKRSDMRIAQSGGSGTISFQVFLSWEPIGGTATRETINYDDVGLDFYGSATFSDASERLIDNGEMLLGICGRKLHGQSQPD
jgi:hypothetical protein